MSIKNCSELGLNLQKIIKRLLADQDLCKFLYYTDKDPLSNPDIDSKLILDEKLIRVIPKMSPEETGRSILVIVIQNGIKDSGNLEYSNIRININVYVPLEQWTIKNQNLRPFAIIGEIQSALDGKNVNGLGYLHGGDFNLEFVGDDLSSYVVEFQVTDHA